MGVRCGLCGDNYPQSRSEGYICNSVQCGLFTVKPINGNYGPWSAWTQCSKSCGGGVRSRVRNCTNPAPAFGGMDCSALGEPQESEPCKTRQICPGQFLSSKRSIVLLPILLLRLTGIDVSYFGQLRTSCSVHLSVSNYLGKRKKCQGLK